MFKKLKGDFMKNTLKINVKNILLFIIVAFVLLNFIKNSPFVYERISFLFDFSYIYSFNTFCMNSLINDFKFVCFTLCNTFFVVKKQVRFIKINSYKNAQAIESRILLFFVQRSFLKSQFLSLVW